MMRYMQKKTRKQTTSFHKIFPVAMPHIHTFSSRALWEVAAWHALIANIITMKTPHELEFALKMFTTPHERSVLLRRVATINRILDGKSYREIAKELWCTQQTISALKKALLDSSYSSYYERSKTERKKKTYSTSRVFTKKEIKKPVHTRRTKYGTIKINR